MNNEITCLADIDLTNSVYFLLKNPHYAGSEIMDLSFEYPKDRINILQIFKEAQRLDLSLYYRAHNHEALEWLAELYKTYIGEPENMKMLDEEK